MKEVNIKHYEISWKEIQEKFGIKKQITSMIVDFAEQNLQVYLDEES
jgi:hypothetical protein